MPLVDLSMVEQRYDAVREVLDGATVKDTAIRYGVDRRTLHRWLVRYATEGLAALANRSSKPDRCPHQISPEIEARIVELRRSQPGWGPRTILNKLRRELEAPPSRSAIYRCLIRHRLIQPKPRRRRRQDYRRWERARSMELWQIDVMGGMFLSSGIGLSIVTGRRRMGSRVVAHVWGRVSGPRDLARSRILDDRRLRDPGGPLLPSLLDLGGRDAEDVPDPALLPEPRHPRSVGRVFRNLRDLGIRTALRDHGSLVRLLDVLGREVGDGLT